MQLNIYCENSFALSQGYIERTYLLQTICKQWKELVSLAIGIGFILSVIVVPFTVTAEFETRIKKLEEELQNI